MMRISHLVLWVRSAKKLLVDLTNPNFITEIVYAMLSHGNPKSHYEKNMNYMVYSIMEYFFHFSLKSNIKVLERLQIHII